MKILLIYNRYRDSGGEDRYFYGLTRQLRQHGHKVKTYTEESSTILKNPLTLAKVLFLPFYNPVSKQKLQYILTQFKPNLVQMHNLFPLIGYEPYDLCRKAHIPFIQRINNYRLLWGFTQNMNVQMGFDSFPMVSLIFFKISYLKYLFQNILAAPNKYLFPSRFAFRLHTKILPFFRIKSAISPDFFIENTFFEKRTRSDYFLYYGRLSKEKGIIELLNNFSKLPQAKLVVIGDGPLAHEVANYKKFPNITIYKKMSFTKLQPFIAHALFTILPSRWYDVLPNVLIESFSQGTPVIVPRWGVFKEIVRERKTGLFYTYNSHNSLKKVILSALAPKSTSDLMLKHIKKEYITRYSKEVSYKRILSLYKSVISS